MRIILAYLYSKLVDSPMPVAEIRSSERELLDEPRIAAGDAARSWGSDRWNFGPLSSSDLDVCAAMPRCGFQQPCLAA